MQKLFRNILFVVAVLLAILSITSLVFVILGFRPFILKSDSMEPLYRKGSLVWVDTKIGVSDIKPDDVLVYHADTGTMIMHRLVSVDTTTASAASSTASSAVSDPDQSKGNTLVATFKGDANTTVEEIALTDVNLVGKEFFTLPWIGGIVSVIIAAPWISVVIIGIIILIACWPSRSSRSSQHSIRTRKISDAARR